MEDIKPNILIVEDDIELAQWMQEYLLNKAFDVAVVHNGEDAIVHIQFDRFRKSKDILGNPVEEEGVAINQVSTSRSVV